MDDALHSIFCHAEPVISPIGFLAPSPIWLDHRLDFFRADALSVATLEHDRARRVLRRAPESTLAGPNFGLPVLAPEPGSG